jgi:hypothetical protein
MAMALIPEQPPVIGRRLRKHGLYYGILALIVAAWANIMAVYLPSDYIECQRSPAALCHDISTADLINFLPARRLIATFPVLTVLILAGSIVIAVLGWNIERRARRILQGQQGSGQPAWSQRRVIFLASVAPVLQVLPLVIVTAASFVALFMFPPP